MIWTVLPEAFDLLRKKHKESSSGSGKQEIQDLVSTHQFKVTKSKDEIIAQLDSAKDLNQLGFIYGEFTSNNHPQSKQEEELKKIQEIYKNKKIAVLNHDDDLSVLKINKTQNYYAQKIFPWFCYFKLYPEVFWLMENY